MFPVETTVPLAMKMARRTIFVDFLEFDVFFMVITFSANSLYPKQLVYKKYRNNNKQKKKTK
jgi:hypothetical protein